MRADKRELQGGIELYELLWGSVGVYRFRGCLKENRCSVSLSGVPTTRSFLIIIRTVLLLTRFDRPASGLLRACVT